MATLSINTPEDLGAVRVKIVDPDGEVLRGLSTPKNQGVEIKNLKRGEYDVFLEPIGGTPQIISLELAGEEGEVVLGSADVASIRRPEPNEIEARETVKPASDVVEAATLPESLEIMPQAGVNDPLYFLGLKTKPVATMETPSPETAVKHRNPVIKKSKPELVIGLSNDAVPFGPGGWRPAAENEFTIDQRNDEIIVTLPREEVAPLPAPENARIRMSATLTDGNAYRMLLPLFGGGTKVMLRRSVQSREELDIQISPIDPARLALSQVLAAGSSSESKTVLDKFTEIGSLRDFIANDVATDPWTAVMGLLAQMRTTSEPAIMIDDFTDEIASRFGWMTDALILKARTHILRSNQLGADDYFERKIALKTLIRARRVGAPYFYHANVIAMDVLAALASQPVSEKPGREPDGFVEDVAIEKRRWAHFVAWQGQAGAFFYWRRLKNFHKPHENFERIFGPLTLR